MPEPKRPLKVFLCHAHADRDAVRGLYTRLTKDGVDAWLDKEKLLGGADWEYEIRNAVRESDVVIVCHSKQFNQKGFRQKEVKIALEEADLLPKGEIFIIPVRLEECNVLDDLKRWHWVDLFESDGYEKLVRALGVRADKIGATLQVKRSWLPRITTPRTKLQKPVEIKKTEDLRKKIDSSIDEIPNDEPPDKFPDGWDSEWMPPSESEQAKSEAAVKLTREKIEKEYQLKREKIIKDAKRQQFLISLRYRFASIRNYASPILLGAGAIVLLIFVFYYMPKNIPVISSTPTNSPTSIDTIDSVEVSTPSSTPTKNVITATSLLTEITDAKDVQMVLVPVGEFTMGGEGWGWRDDTGPAHQVYLNAFYMDVYEVTNMLYKECVLVGSCTLPQKNRSFTRSSYYDNTDYRNYPVIYVDWNQAQAYCEWRGGSLPTEAQWEKAARGIDGRSYPWGDQFDGNYINFCDKNCSFYWRDEVSDDGYVDTSPVGSYEDGKSIYGIHDLAGNVWEWVYDWYDGSYYVNSPSSNPSGPAVGSYHVVRGGSWSSRENETSSVIRYTNRDNEYIYDSLNIGNFIGFRCARSANP